MSDVVGGPKKKKITLNVRLVHIFTKLSTLCLSPQKTFLSFLFLFFLFGSPCLSTKSLLGLSSPVALHLRHARAVTKGDGREEDELESQEKRRGRRGRDGKAPGEGRAASAHSR